MRKRLIKPERSIKVSFCWCSILKRYHNGLLDGFLNLHTLSGNGLIQFSFKGQEIHVGLGLWDQVSDLTARHQYSGLESNWIQLEYKSKMS